jgi:hypothetical protein
MIIPQFRVSESQMDVKKPIQPPEQGATIQMIQPLELVMEFVPADR